MQRLRAWLGQIVASLKGLWCNHHWHHRYRGRSPFPVWSKCCWCKMEMDHEPVEKCRFRTAREALVLMYAEARRGS